MSYYGLYITVKSQEKTINELIIQLDTLKKEVLNDLIIQLDAMKKKVDFLEETFLPIPENHEIFYEKVYVKNPMKLFPYVDNDTVDKVSPNSISGT